ncbi:MAG TPA: MbnP family protein [Flavobacteriales bacterium]|jgi:hypothetical protein|nr:MbnP family protein [Flavobacteriales bacterium]
MNTRFLLAVMACVVGLSACKKDSDDPEPTPTPTTPGNGTLRVSFRFLNGTDTFHLGDLLHDGAGTLIRFDTVRFFISGLHLHDDADGIIAEYHDTYVLLDAEHPVNTFDLGTLQAQHVHALAFDVGVEAVANHGDPATADPPLNDLSMHLGATTGYKFAVLHGRVDSDHSNTITDTDTAFSYVICTDALLAEDEVHVHHDLTAGETYTIDAWADMAVVLSGVDVTAHPTSHTLDDLPLASQVRDSLVSALGPDPDE